MGRLFGLLEQIQFSPPPGGLSAPLLVPRKARHTEIENGDGLEMKAQSLSHTHDLKPPYRIAPAERLEGQKSWQRGISGAHQWATIQMATTVPC